jgi:hypothetical protein
MYRDRVHWAGPSNSDQLNLLRGGGVEDNRTKTFPSLLSFTGAKIRGNRFLEVKVKKSRRQDMGVKIEAGWLVKGEDWWAKRFSHRQAKEARNKKRRRRMFYSDQDVVKKLGRNWVSKFLNRNPNLASKFAQRLDRQRKFSKDITIMKDYFCKVIV